MIYKNRYVELFVNGKLVEFESQDSINIRFNNVLFDPTKIASNQGEYSFSFNLPCTKNNNKIFDYANNLSKLNKFHTRWDAELYADGNIIFKGSLTLNGVEDGMYNVNLVSIKNYSLDDIFGDAVLSDIPWYIQFDGCPSIDYYNDEQWSTVTFPLVSYGAFQKAPKYKDSVASDYTSKYDMDKYNLWYMESFQPSLSLVETIKKAFEWKGYKIQGDALKDYFLNEIFMSQNLADEQIPTYNLGNPKLGSLTLRTNWITPSYGGTVHELKFPYYKSGENYIVGDGSGGYYMQENPYNFTKVKLYDMLSTSEGAINVYSSESYLFDPDEKMVVIPADGFYKIDMDVSAFLNTSSNLTAGQYVHHWDTTWGKISDNTFYEDITFKPDFKVTTPLEIHLVKNFDDDIELIKGKYNLWVLDGFPDNETQLNKGTVSNYKNWLTCYPHEDLGYYKTIPNAQPAPTDISYSKWPVDSAYGYVYADGSIMAYDPLVNPNFIMGITSMGNKEGNGCMAVIKNGYSWNNLDSEKHDVMYNQNGYLVGNVNTTSLDVHWDVTNYNSNTYPQAPNSFFSQTLGTITSHFYALVYLHRNDKLRLFAVQRDYTTTGGSDVSYETQAQVSINISAASPNNLAKLRMSNFGYYTPSEFDVDLRVSNFLNNETKISDWINDVATAFNLEITQNNKTVSINKKKKYVSLTAVDIDDRVNSANAKSKIIEYPKSMAIKYKIDTEEHGFYTTVPPEHLEDDDWIKYGDSGFTVIELNDDSYVTNKDEKQLKFSYTWYDNFNFYQCDSAFTQTSDTPVTVRIPVISKEEYMIDGYDYTESMNHDGYGLAQRFWFRPTRVGNLKVWTRGYPTESMDVFTPENVYNYLNLSYKTSENSLLKQYFNISSQLSSNYVEVDVYLSPDEYNRLKNGASVRFDSDLYEVVEINGYDPTRNELTTLKLMKKTS